LQARINKEEQQANVLLKLFFLLLGMCLINPSGINGFLVPFHIDKAYLFPISENRSLFDSLKVKSSPFRPVLLYFLALLGMLGAALFFMVRREGLRKNIFNVILTLFISIAAIKAWRMMGPFGYFWIPLSTYVYGKWIQAETAKFRKYFEITFLVLGIIVSASVNFDWKQGHSLGLVPHSNDAAEFFKREKISGPIFNNYDIGGYLIFHLSPGHQLFVDNRMEAFPKDFLIKTFVRMQLNDDFWHKVDQEYHFNVIFITPEQASWQFIFLIHRLGDPAWAPVFVKDESIILLKRNAQNAKVIKRYEISADVIKILAPTGGTTTGVGMFFKPIKH
jgi:hypothetical protein